MNVWMYIVCTHDAVQLCKFNQDAHALLSLDVATFLFTLQRKGLNAHKFDGKGKM